MSNIRQNQRECFYPLKLTSTFQIVHPVNMLPISTILWLGLKVSFVWFIWAENLVCLTTSHSSDGFFSVSMLSSSATDKIYRYTGGERLCLVYCRSFIAVAFIFQCGSPTSDQKRIAIAITELVYETKEKK